MSELLSYNTDSLACPRCQGTGQVILDVQYLPDVPPSCTATSPTPSSPSTNPASDCTS